MKTLAILCISIAIATTGHADPVTAQPAAPSANQARPAAASRRAIPFKPDELAISTSARTVQVILTRGKTADEQFGWVYSDGSTFEHLYRLAGGDTTALVAKVMELRRTRQLGVVVLDDGAYRSGSVTPGPTPGPSPPGEPGPEPLREAAKANELQRDLMRRASSLAVGDKTVGDKTVRDKTVGDKAVGDKMVGNKAVDRQTVGGKK